MRSCTKKYTLYNFSWNSILYHHHFWMLSVGGNSNLYHRHFWMLFVRVYFFLFFFGRCQSLFWKVLLLHIFGQNGELEYELKFCLRYEGPNKVVRPQWHVHGGAAKFLHKLLVCYFVQRFAYSWSKRQKEHPFWPKLISHEY